MVANAAAANLGLRIDSEDSVSVGWAADAQILMLEADTECCMPIFQHAHLLDRILPQPTVNALIDAAHVERPQVILMSAMNRSTWMLSRWRALFELQVPVVIVHAPDQAFVLKALRSGAHECLLDGTSSEISALKVQRALDQERNRLLARARLRDLALTSQIQGDFFRVFSHDLKGPLTNLRMALYLLRDLVTDGAEVNELLASADTSLGEMQEMVRTFLDTAAVQPGAIEAHADCFSPEDIIRRLLRQHGVTASHRGIALDAQCDDILILADPQLFAHVLSNLIGNAIKFTPSGGRVDVRAQVVNDRARISVIDSGPGIPPEKRRELFQPFARISNQPSDMEASTGLGLWIVKYLTELQRGSVGAQFPDHGGSIFYVDLPTCARSL